MPLVFPRGSLCALKFLQKSDEELTRYAGEYRRMKCRTTFINFSQLEPLKSAAVCNAIVRMCPLSFHMWDHCGSMRHWDQISSLQRSLPCINIHEPEHHRRPDTSPGCLDPAHLLATVHLCRPPKRWEEELQHALYHHPSHGRGIICVWQCVWLTITKCVKDVVVTEADEYKICGVGDSHFWLMVCRQQGGWPQLHSPRQEDDDLYLMVSRWTTKCPKIHQSEAASQSWW